MEGEQRAHLTAAMEGEVKLADTLHAGKAWIRHNTQIKDEKDDIVAKLSLDPQRYIMPDSEVVNWTGDFVPEQCTCVPYKYRKALLKFIVHPYTENTLIVLIISSCVLLALDSPWKHEAVTDTADALELCFVIIFLLEMVLKLVAMGIWGTPEAYFTSSWNRLDFVCVIASVLSYGARVYGHTRSTASGGVGRSIRALRTLRPLRLINKSDQLRAMFSAIQAALPTIVVVALLSVFFMFLFAILGVQFFSGVSQK